MPTVLISGANRGLGLEFVRQYLKDGATVIAACRDPAAAQPLAQLARDYHSALNLLEVDVADSASVERAAAHAPQGAIDILINCAGVMGHPGQRLGSIDYDDWMHVLQVNVLGVARMSEAFLERIAKSERRLIVTITSGMGSIGDNTSGGAILYRTSKAAVNMVMRSAALDLKARGITCVVMNPGWVKTDMGGPNAKLSPQESIAAMRAIIARIGLKDSGRFFNHDGSEYPW